MAIGGRTFPGFGNSTSCQTWKFLFILGSGLKRSEFQEHPDRLDHGVKNSPSVAVVHLDMALDTQAWKLLVSREEQAWSLVDRPSFILMQPQGMTKALTIDTLIK